MKFFKGNINLKLFSVFLALLLWLIVFNISNPEQKGSRNVELNILNQDVFSSENKTWEVDRETITISYTVRSNKASSVKASDFNVYIDLNDYSITGSVPVYVELKNPENSASILDIVARPSVVHVSVEEEDGYVVASIHTEPDTIYATGPESTIGRISSVGLLINVDGLNKTTSGKGKAVFYDANGKTIDSLGNVTLSQEEVDYTVVIHKKKDLKIAVNATGVPQSGYSLESLDISPKTVSVSGNESLLESINSIDLPPLDISGMSNDVQKVYSLDDYLAKGVSLTEPNNTVTVTARLKKNAETTEESTTESKEESKPTEESTTESKEESSFGSEEGSDGKASIKNSSSAEKKASVEESHQSTQEGKASVTENKSP